MVLALDNVTIFNGKITTTGKHIIGDLEALQKAKLWASKM